MADIPDYSRNSVPSPADEHSVSAADLVVADLQNWEAEDITASAQAEVYERKRYGLVKYKTILHKDCGRDFALDAEDESIDKVNYLRMLMVRGDAPQAWLEPLYRDELWSLVALHTFRTTGELLPHLMKHSFPLAGLDEVGAQNVDPTQDDGHACRIPPGEVFDTEWINCGALQFDHKMCTRSLVDHEGAYGWCPRHGARQEPNEKADERSHCERCERPIERHGTAWMHSFDVLVSPCPRACPPGGGMTKEEVHQAVRETDAPEDVLAGEDS